MYVFFREGKLNAVACMNKGAKASEVAFWIAEGKTPSIEELRYIFIHR